MVQVVKRFWRWLQHPEIQPLGVPYETVVALRNESYEMGRVIGMAQGELKGRLELAQELGQMYGIEGGNKPCDFEQVKKIKARQIH